jgi:hypothetical protein
MGGLHLDPPSVNTGAGSTFVFVPDNDGAISGQCFMKQNLPLPMSAFHLADILPSTLIALPSGEEICDRDWEWIMATGYCGLDELCILS